jgi:hypothetical protein
MKPCCRLHLIIGCASLQEYFFESETMVGCFMRSSRASGAYAFITIPFFWQNEVMFVRVLKGWTSIRFTAGITRGFVANSSSMLEPIIADSAYLHLPIGDGILHGSLACQSASLASVWTVRQKQVDVT